MTGTPLRKVGGGGYVSPAAFAGQFKFGESGGGGGGGLRSGGGSLDVPTIVPSVVPIHRQVAPSVVGKGGRKKAGLAEQRVSSCGDDVENPGGHEPGDQKVGFLSSSVGLIVFYPFFKINT